MRLKENLKRVNDGSVDLRSGAPRYVPVTFHFIADDAGVGYPVEEQALEQLANLNGAYAPQEKIFYIDEIRRTANSLIFYSPDSNLAIAQMDIVRDDDAMDVFVTEDAEGNPSGLGKTLAYYDQVNDWLVTRRDQFNGKAFTLNHETGHFFSLLHTFLGWECQPYDIAKHGNPVTITVSPCISFIDVELNNGSNCLDGGDLICDTPPDYNFGLGWSVGGDQCAEYDAGTMDPSGEVVDPMENNFMGYFLDCDEYVFTPLQQAAITSDYATPRRAYLRTGFVPNTDEVKNDVVYNYPINDVESSNYNWVGFDWEDVSGANQYLLIVDTDANFSTAPKRYILNKSDHVLQDLVSATKYFWKVWPFNESQTGAGWADTQSFLTGTSTSVQEIPFIESFNLFPNPVTGDNLVVSVQSSKSFSADLTILDISGRIYSHTDGQHVIADIPLKIDVSTQGMPPGMYFVRIASDLGIMTGKFIVR